MDLTCASAEPGLYPPASAPAGNLRTLVDCARRTRLPCEPKGIEGEADYAEQFLATDADLRPN